jgi:quinol monooxygenase YgiN
MAGFVQIIEFKTSRFDDVQALNDSYRSGRAGRGGGPTRVTVVTDRDRPNTYLTIAEFESYDAAMANSADPETTAFAQKMGELCDGPPTFYNTDLTWSESFD